MVSADQEIWQSLTANCWCLLVQVSNVYKMSSVARLYKQAVISDLRYSGCLFITIIIKQKADICDLVCPFIPFSISTEQHTLHLKF